MDDLRDMYQDQMARIANYDSRKGTDLLDTLETYLECAGNLTKTSNRLFVHRNMVGLIAFDFVLRIVHGGVMRVSLVIDVSCMYLDDLARDVPGLGVPGYVIADFEFMGHGLSPRFRLARLWYPYRPKTAAGTRLAYEHESNLIASKRIEERVQRSIGMANRANKRPIRRSIVSHVDGFRREKRLRAMQQYGDEDGRVFCRPQRVARAACQAYQIALAHQLAGPRRRQLDTPSRH